MKINVDINQEVKKNREALAKELGQDKRVVNFLKDNELDATFLENNVQKFKDWIDGLEECKKCKSLEDCVKPVKGHYFELVYDGILKKELRPCRYQLEYEKRTKYLKNYVIRDYPDDLIDVSLLTIDLKNEDIAYLDVLTKVSEFLDNPKGAGFYIFGDVGVGKTF